MKWQVPPLAAEAPPSGGEVGGDGQELEESGPAVEVDVTQSKADAMEEAPSATGEEPAPMELELDGLNQGCGSSPAPPPCLPAFLPPPPTPPPPRPCLGPRADRRARTPVPWGPGSGPPVVVEQITHDPRCAGAPGASGKILLLALFTG
jgi:hypothetical protein